MLSKEDFYLVGSKTNLTSIDLILKYDNKYLVGKRINNPAKGYYFVPGGFFTKNELLKDVFKRISKKELTIELEMKDFNFLMISQHWYENNFLDDSYGTHYLSIAYTKELTYDEFTKINLNDQHSDTVFLSENEILEKNDVHPYTKGFFDIKYFDLYKLELKKRELQHINKN